MNESNKTVLKWIKDIKGLKVDVNIYTLEKNNVKSKKENIVMNKYATQMSYSKSWRIKKWGIRFGVI